MNILGENNFIGHNTTSALEVWLLLLLFPFLSSFFFFQEENNSQHMNEAVPGCLFQMNRYSIQVQKIANP